MKHKDLIRKSIRNVLDKQKIELGKDRKWWYENRLELFINGYRR